MGGSPAEDLGCPQVLNKVPTSALVLARRTAVQPETWAWSLRQASFSSFAMEAYCKADTRT